jgi:hypothetical protein
LTLTIVGRARRRSRVAEAPADDGGGFFIDRYGQAKEPAAAPEVTEFVDPRDSGVADKGAHSMDR